MELTERHITRFTVDGNKTARPGDRDYISGLVVHIERFGIGTEWWRITNAGLVYNHQTRRWDHESTLREATNKSRYLTSLSEAERRTDDVVEQLRQEYAST
jgi:hypothetical protein